jgi:PII-like signaling protein
VRIELPEESVLLRIFISEGDRYHGQPLYEALVLKAREAGLAGATVLRGPLGYGHTTHLHTTKILRLSNDLPLVVEIVETQQKIDAFLPVLDEMMESGLVTIEKARVLRYGPNPKKQSAT